MEGLLGPKDEIENAFGFSTSDAETPEYLDERLVSVMNSISGTLLWNQDLFGQDTREIYEGFRQRLEEDRPRDERGSRIGSEDLPPFLTPADFEKPQ